jgi:hypothetical protein
MLLISGPYFWTFWSPGNISGATVTIWPCGSSGLTPSTVTPRVAKFCAVCGSTLPQSGELGKVFASVFARFGVPVALSNPFVGAPVASTIWQVAWLQWVVLPGVPRSPVGALAGFSLAAFCASARFDGGVPATARAGGGGGAGGGASGAVGQLPNQRKPHPKCPSGSTLLRGLL